MQTRQRRKSNVVEFFTLNISAIPAQHENEVYYSNLINNFFSKDLKIEYGKDFYYKMTTLNKYNLNDTIVYYGLIKKYLQLNSIKWEKTTEKQVEEIRLDIPENVEGNKGAYEFIFIPKIHKLAFIKKGKIDSTIIKKGAPLLAMQNILQIGFENVVEERKKLHVDIVQSKEIIETIFNSQLVSLEMKFHYSNPDLMDDYGKFMDDLYSETEADKINISLTGKKSSPINTKSKLVNGSLKVVRSNGTAKAKVINENGKVKNIDTKDHPEVSEIEVKEFQRNIFTKTIQAIKDYLLS
jgi:hypothetical protein